MAFIINAAMHLLERRPHEVGWLGEWLKGVIIVIVIIIAVVFNVFLICHNQQCTN